MKKAYRDRVLKGLYTDLASRDFDVREKALFELALMLQRANLSSGAHDPAVSFDENLSREQLRMRLSPTEQRQIVDHLLRLAAMHRDSRATAFWTLGELRADIGLAPALALVQATGHQLKNDAAYEVCQALRRWLQSDQLDKVMAAEQLALQDPAVVLKRWSDSVDDRLAASASSLIDIVADFKV